VHLKKVRIWNFRGIGTKGKDLPGLEIDFNPELNVLIGSNDSGKTTIVDAIRYCLGTQTYDYIRLDIEDFYQDPNTKRRSRELKIECIFGDFTPEEAGQFLEWIDIKKVNDKTEIELKVWLSAEVKNNNDIITTIRAGIDEEGQYFSGDAKNLLRVTYLKPLRDAENELTPGRRSRLYQILKSHPIFKKEDINKEHPLEKYFSKAEQSVLEFFNKDNLEKNKDLEIKGDEKGGKEIKDKFQQQTKEFLEETDSRTPEFKIANTELNSILKKLELILEENKSGLGTLNLLYMASELIHLQRENYLGLRLALIEELEAHLHPQAQLRVLKNLIYKNRYNAQYILTTHSTILGSSIPLKYIKLCFNDHIFSLDPTNTALSEDDYQFLERFLDATKANLFFAKGVIIVEGDAENILIPTLAEIIDRPLHKYGVSIVNVGGKALLRYANIFKQKDGSTIPIKVAVVTDLDFKRNKNDKSVGKNNDNIYNEQDIKDSRSRLERKFNTEDGNIRAFISPLKTLEFDIACGNLWEEMYKAIQVAKKIKNSKRDWLSNKEFNKLVKKIKNIEEKDRYKRAEKIYKPLKNYASKPITAQWFAKILKEEGKDSLSKIKRDYEENRGIKYLIEAIEHVTKPLNWRNNDGNNDNG